MQHPAPRPGRHLELFALAFAAGLLLLPSLGDVPFRRAEIYFADGARSMVERGDWLIPYFRGLPFFDKPALTYWLLAGAFELFGFSAGAARLIPAFAAVLAVLVTVWLGRLLWKDWDALSAGWVLLATASFMNFGRIAMSDMLLVLWSTLAVALVAAAQESRWPGRWVIALGAVLGLGFLTKGPIALLVPGFGAASLLWFKRKERSMPLLAALWLPAALSAAVFLLLAFGWFAAVYLRLGWAPLEHFFLRENLQRFAAETYDAGRPVWFYIVTYLGAGAPWSLFLPLAAVYFLRRSPDSSAKALLAWMGLVVFLLSLSRGKLDYYLLPLYPAASLVVARYLAAAVWGRGVRVYAGTVLAMVGLLLLGLPMALGRIALEWRPQGLLFGTIAVVFVGVGLGCLAASRRPQPARVCIALAVATCAGFGVINIWVLPAFYAGQPNKVLIDDVLRERAGRPDISIAFAEDPTQVHRDLLFYSRLPVTDVEDVGELKDLALSGSPYILLAEEPAAILLREIPGMREIGEYRYLASRVFSLRGLLGQTGPARIVVLANFEK